MAAERRVRGAAKQPGILLQGEREEGGGWEEMLAAEVGDLPRAWGPLSEASTQDA